MGTCPSGWGPDKREDLWLKIDFGSKVEVDRIDLAIRADLSATVFAHNLWRLAHVRSAKQREEESPGRRTSA